MTRDELTRRDALKALGAAGVTVTGGVAALTWDDRDEPAAEFGDHERQTVQAVATVVYPTELDGIETFVDSYLMGRIDDDDRAAAVADAVAELDDYSREWEDSDFRALGSATRDETLRAMGVDIADPDPDGHPAQRVRYYLVNELLFGLYSSPTGGELVGIENPQGHPGGTQSYRQSPQ